MSKVVCYVCGKEIDYEDAIYCERELDYVCEECCKLCEMEGGCEWG